MPICDEFIVNIGPSEDNTLELIKSIDSPKIKIIQSQWNPNLRKGGYIYAQQTIGKNKKKAKMIYDRNRLIFHWKNITDKDLRRQHFFYLGVKLLLSIIFCRWHYLKSFKDALKYIKQIKQDNIRQITRFTDKEILRMFLQK